MRQVIGNAQIGFRLVGRTTRCNALLEKAAQPHEAEWREVFRNIQCGIGTAARPLRQSSRLLLVAGVDQKHADNALRVTPVKLPDVDSTRRPADKYEFVINPGVT